MLVSDSVPNRSIVVIKFFNPADAAEFAEAYNGKPFNSMEVCPCLKFQEELLHSDMIFISRKYAMSSMFYLSISVPMI